MWFYEDGKINIDISCLDRSICCYKALETTSIFEPDASLDDWDYTKYRRYFPDDMAASVL